ncbi:MAG: flavodoxin family protein [Desulfovibrio sp.]|nr:flavodoxin family protein [Desulfovibrio sp.]
MSAKRVLAINGSPRRSGNTATLLEEALKGARDCGAETELVHLYRLRYRGCISCFSCKRKDREHGICAMKDDLSPVLERIREVDALLLGSPIYFMNVSSGFLAFFERLFFSNYLYSREIPTVFPKVMPSALFLTMNMTEAHVEQFRMRERLDMLEMTITQHFRMKPRQLWAYDTYQFDDYSRYESSIFEESAKMASRTNKWPLDCQEAYRIGRELASSHE